MSLDAEGDGEEESAHELKAITFIVMNNRGSRKRKPNSKFPLTVFHVILCNALCRLKFLNFVF